ncbi:MAG: hypothetical protein R2755_11350 [Acidimicrobiales bacterium]
MRLAAGVAVGVVALGRVLAVLTTRRHPPADDRPHDAARSHRGPCPPARRRGAPAVARGPLRVEVAVAVWSLAADHGVALGVLAALLCAPLDAADAADAARPGRTGRALPGGRAAHLGRAARPWWWRCWWRSTASSGSEEPPGRRAPPTTVYTRVRPVRVLLEG